MSELVTQKKPRWEGSQCGDDYLYALVSDCKKCGKETFTPLDSPRLQTGLCASCYFEEKEPTLAKN